MVRKQNKRASVTIKILVIIFLSVLLISAYALLLNYNRRNSHIKLLAVSQLNNKSFIGRTADLYLSIKPGSGQVFMDTFPLTKMDTQISTRFAKEIACKESGVDCSKYDFFYTIRASSPIIGGPSASGAIAALTLAKLNGLRVNENIALTGTINSGALIGPVGGLKEKIKAASKAGIKEVLIPDIERFIREDNITINNINKTTNITYAETNKTENTTLDLIKYGKDFGVKVIPVSNLFQVIYHFTGENISHKYKTVENQEYNRIMKGIAIQLCNRTDELKELLNDDRLNNSIAEIAESNKKSSINNITNITEEILKLKKFANKRLEESNNLTLRAEKAFNDSHYYSAASYCFGAGVKISSIYTLQEQEFEQKLSLINKSVNKVENELTKNFTTITQLQTYLIVQERLTESAEYVNRAVKDISKNNTLKASEDIAFANERLFSAILWMQFYEMPSKRFDISTSDLRDSCLSSVSEANELYQYVNLILPIDISSIKDKIDDADKEVRLGNYAVCLYKATKAKADLSLISSTLGVREEQIGELMDKKLRAAERSISESSSLKIFPIMAYSYYDYANSLRKYDTSSALLYAEYSIELSNIDIYFTPRKKSWIKLYRINNLRSLEFTLGFITGIYLILVLIIIKSVSDELKHNIVRQKTTSSIKRKLKVIRVNKHKIKRRRRKIKNNK